MISYRKLFILLENKQINRTQLINDGVISANTLIRLRNNRSVSLYTIEQLSNYLDCDIHDLFSIE